MKKFAITASAVSLAIGVSSVALAQGGCNPNGGITGGSIKGLHGLKEAQSNGGANPEAVVQNRLSNKGGNDGEIVLFIGRPGVGLVGGRCDNFPTEDDDSDPSPPS